MRALNVGISISLKKRSNNELNGKVINLKGDEENETQAGNQ